MSHMRATLSLFILALSSLAAIAQSFDCKLAQTPREKTVCADTRLSALDAEIAAGYKALRAQLSPESAALVMADQAEWLHWIDLVCPANGKGIAADQTRCLQNLYFTRAHSFDKTAHLGNTIIFPRSHFLYKAGNANTTNPISPGFGYGSLRWPQIDRPNAAQTTWNNAAKTKAASLAIGFSNDQNATFDTAVDPSGIIDAYFTIDAANDRLIDITFTDGAYPWGAAHPTASRSSFLWWLDHNRALAPPTSSGPTPPGSRTSFRSPSPASRPTPTSKTSSGRATNSPRPFRAPPSSPTTGPPPATASPSPSASTPSALTSSACPTPIIPWSQLKPYLAPTFNPSTLPAPVPKSNP